MIIKEPPSLTQTKKRHDSNVRNRVDQKTYGRSRCKISTFFHFECFQFIEQILVCPFVTISVLYLCSDLGINTRVRNTTPMDTGVVWSTFHQCSVFSLRHFFSTERISTISVGSGESLCTGRRCRWNFVIFMNLLFEMGERFDTTGSETSNGNLCGSYFCYCCYLNLFVRYFHSTTNLFFVIIFI